MLRIRCRQYVFRNGSRRKTESGKARAGTAKQTAQHSTALVALDDQPGAISAVVLAVEQSACSVITQVNSRPYEQKCPH
jgi:prephenate dehydratase